MSDDRSGLRLFPVRSADAIPLGARSNINLFMATLARNALPMPSDRKLRYLCFTNPEPNILQGRFWLRPSQRRVKEPICFDTLEGISRSESLSSLPPINATSVAARLGAREISRSSTASDISKNNASLLECGWRYSDGISTAAWIRPRSCRKAVASLDLRYEMNIFILLTCCRPHQDR